MKNEIEYKGKKYHYTDIDKDKDFDKTNMTSKQILNKMPSYSYNPFINNLYLLKKGEDKMTDLHSFEIGELLNQYNIKFNTNY